MNHSYWLLHLALHNWLSFSRLTICPVFTGTPNALGTPFILSVLPKQPVNFYLWRTDFKSAKSVPNDVKTDLDQILRLTRLFIRHVTVHESLFLDQF